MKILRFFYGLLKLVVFLVLGLFTILYLLLFSRLWMDEVNTYYASFVIIAAIALLFAAWVLPFKKVRKGFFFSGLAVMLAGVIAVSSCVGYNAYMYSITIRENALDIYEYLAFDKNSKIARLGKEASLRFSMTDNLPVLDGAAAFFPLYSAFIEAVYPSTISGLYESGSPYQYNNTIGGYHALALGNADIMFAFAPDKDQLAFAQEKGVEFELIPIGGEGFVFFTNKKNPVTNLTVEQIRSIYAGEITNWKEVGGENTAILPYQRNSGSGSQTALVQFMGDKPLAKAPSELVNSFMWGIIEEVADYKNNRGAMGFSFQNYAKEIVANKKIRLLSVDGVEPTPEHIADGSYPITLPFYMVMRKGERTKEMDALIEWVLSEEGQTLVTASGFAPVAL